MTKLPELKEIEISEMKVGDYFQDRQLVGKDAVEKLTFSIIGDHVYTVTDNFGTLIVARDNGNGHGGVMQVVKYNDTYDKALNKIATPLREELKSLFESYDYLLDDLFHKLIQDALNGTDEEIIQFIMDYQQSTLSFYGWKLVEKSAMEV